MEPAAIRKKRKQHFKTARRVLWDFTVKEISAVTRPAVEGATVRLLKYAEPSISERIGFLNDRLDSLLTNSPSAAAFAEATKSEKETPTMSFEQRVTEIAKRDKLPMTEAMSKARSLHPDEFNAFQKAAKPLSTDKPEIEDEPDAFEAKVAELRRQGFKPTEAMRMARRLHKDDFNRYQAA